MKKVAAVLFGGASGEHEVSIKSAFSILSNIDYEKYNVKPIYINKENKWFEQGLLQSPPQAESQIVVTHSNEYDPFQLNSDVDVVFPITHGPFGEDGHFQAILEIMNVPYVGCDVLSSAIGMDKAVMKDIFAANEIPQGLYMYFYETEFLSSQESVLTSIEEGLKYPCFIKPANLGSSVGINKARNRSELINALEVAFRHDSKVVVEEFIKAREIEIGVLGNNPYTLSSVGEISTTADFYDYEAKYVSTNQNQINIPANIPSNIESQIKDLAVKVANAINVKGLSRIDFFYDEINNRVLINEINTLPGFTKHSMYPMLFDHIGISYKELISNLLNFSVENHKTKKRYAQFSNM